MVGNADLLTPPFVYVINYRIEVIHQACDEKVFSITSRFDSVKQLHECQSMINEEMIIRLNIALKQLEKEQEDRKNERHRLNELEEENLVQLQELEALRSQLQEKEKEENKLTELLNSKEEENSHLATQIEQNKQDISTWKEKWQQNESKVSNILPPFSFFFFFLTFHHL